MFYADPGYEVYLDGYSTLGEKGHRRFQIENLCRATWAVSSILCFTSYVVGHSMRD
ncbi:hypothetical protein M408DRAFT_326534 [Serendipita vermifera MAFF 305830]|uniref:Uncharacterized protein n=1 Tax=Serendipita vermifera MAFF 305830 TaxID=933852 RepID=A0A0C2XV89_SERVB|nr:hypothetical protein M408DRAFT_326534 [Serendipita vermifera MAFF 305830]